MSRRWRNPRPPRGRVFWTPPAQATATTPPPQFLRPAGPRRPPVRPPRGRVFWVTPPPPGPAVIITTGEPYFRWATGTPYLS